MILIEYNIQTIGMPRSPLCWGGRRGMMKTNGGATGLRLGVSVGQPSGLRIPSVRSRSVGRLSQRKFRPPWLHVLANDHPDQGR
jgi:hypothetical protein